MMDNSATTLFMRPSLTGGQPFSNENGRSFCNTESSLRAASSVVTAGSTRRMLSFMSW